MPLSRLYTCQEVWVEAVRDLDQKTVVDIPQWEKYRLVNRAVISVVGQFFDLVANSYMTEVTPTVSGDTFSISSYNIMRMGQNIKCVVTCPNAPYVEALSLEQFVRWRSSAPQNRAKIVWALTADTVQLKKPSSLAYGAMKFWYPRLPAEVNADDTLIDIPDGMPIELVILKLEEILLKRLGLPERDETDKIQQHIRMMYQTFGLELEAEPIKEKALALK